MEDLLRFIITKMFNIQLLIVCLLFVWNFERRPHFPLRLAISVAADLLLFTFLPQLNIWVININFLLSFFANGLVLAFCFRIRLREIVVYNIASAALQNISSQLTILLFSLPALRPYDQIWLFLLAALFIFAICCVAFYFLYIRRTGRDGKLKVDNFKLWTLLICTVAVVFIFAPYADDHIEPPAARTVAILLVILVNILVLFTEFGVFEKSALQKENETIENILYTQRSQQERAERNIDMINQKCHDIKHAIAALRLTEDPAARAHQLDAMELSVQEYDLNANTGSRVLDALLTDQCFRCRDKEIRFTYLADGRRIDFLEPVDLYTMLGDAFDNAVEALERVENPEKRILTLELLPRQDFLFINLENYCSDPPLIDKDLPKSSKPDDGRHGIGLRSIRYIAEKYGGTMSVCVEDGYFCLKITIPIPQGK